MPVLVQSTASSGTISSVQNSTYTLQNIVDDARTYVDLIPQLSASGYSQRPAIFIANEVMSKIISQPLNWKWNRANITPFLTVALQQDYVTSATNLYWLEQGWRQDVNNTSTPKPLFSMEAVRDLQATSIQQNPFNISWIPNRLATMGTWVANTSYPTGLGQAMTPSSPIQQFLDANNNILYVTTNGISGNSKPSVAANSLPGTTVTDGTVVWTVADPNAVAIRVSPLPAFSGIVWQITPVYQMKPPKFTSLQNTLAPIPDEYAYLFRNGFIAMAKMQAGSKDATMAYAAWEESIQTALRAGDRELESATIYPASGLGDGSNDWTMIGPAFPFYPN